MYGVSQVGSPTHYGSMYTYRYSTNRSIFSVQELYVSCSLLCLTGFYTSNEKDCLGLLKKAAVWAYNKGNYTKFFCNTTDTAGTTVKHLDILLKAGFQKVGRAHKNRRTGMMVYWLQGDIKRIINTLTKLGY